MKGNSVGEEDSDRKGESGERKLQNVCLLSFYTDSQGSERVPDARQMPLAMQSLPSCTVPQPSPRRMRALTFVENCTLPS